MEMAMSSPISSGLGSDYTLNDFLIPEKLRRNGGQTLSYLTLYNLGGQECGSHASAMFCGKPFFPLSKRHLLSLPA